MNNEQKRIAFCKGCLACFPKARLAGTVLASGVDDVGAIEGHTSLHAAYEMGKLFSAQKE